MIHEWQLPYFIGQTIKLASLKLRGTTQSFTIPSSSTTYKAACLQSHGTQKHTNMDQQHSHLHTIHISYLV